MVREPQEIDKFVDYALRSDILVKQGPMLVSISEACDF